MFKVLLTRDLNTGAALYDDEAILVGIYNSIDEAEAKLGNLLRICTIKEPTARDKLITQLIDAL